MKIVNRIVVEFWPPRFGYKSCRCEISIWHAKKNRGMQFCKDQLSTGLALDIRQEKIFAFVFISLLGSKPPVNGLIVFQVLIVASGVSEH